MREDAKNARTPTSCIGKNFRSLILFLAKANRFTHADFSYLLTECKALEEDLDRTARVNRIMEWYTWYVQEAYFDVGRTVDETYRGEYEVERISGTRLLVLQEYSPEGTCHHRPCFQLISSTVVSVLTQSLGDTDMGDVPLRSFTTYFPVPLVQRMRRGDVLALQICHLEQNGVWVPYMYSCVVPLSLLPLAYSILKHPTARGASWLIRKLFILYFYMFIRQFSGFTPCRDDGGTVTPTERQARVAAPATAGVRSYGAVDERDAASALSQSFRRLDLTSRQRSVDRVGGRQATRSRTPQRSSIMGLPTVGTGATAAVDVAGMSQSASASSPGAGLDFNFNELEYTDGYFADWEGDIDTDEDFGDVLRSPDEGEGSESGVNLYGALRERHHQYV